MFQWVSNSIFPYQTCDEEWCAQQATHYLVLVPQAGNAGFRLSMGVFACSFHAQPIQ